MEINKKVPDFEFTSTDNADDSLSNYIGKKVILYFYPKDNTPGCTLEGNDFNHHYAEFEKKNAVIFGISRDSLVSHAKFCEKQGFTFPLISDADGKICEMFDVIKEKNMFGKKVRGIQRSTFLIDEQGRLVKEWRKVNVLGHAKDVLKAL